MIRSHHLYVLSSREQQKRSSFKTPSQVSKRPLEVPSRPVRDRNIYMCLSITHTVSPTVQKQPQRQKRHSPLTRRYTIASFLRHAPHATRGAPPPPPPPPPAPAKQRQPRTIARRARLTDVFHLASRHVLRSVVFHESLHRPQTVLTDSRWHIFFFLASRSLFFSLSLSGKKRGWMSKRVRSKKGAFMTCTRIYWE